MDFGGKQFHRQVKALTGLSIATIEYPGGRSRNTVRLLMSDGSGMYATARPANNRSTREIELLWALDRANVFCPRVLGVDEGFFLHSDVGRNRLSDVLAHPMPEAGRAALISAALGSLVEARAALDQAGFSQRLEARFATDEIRLARAKLPQKLAEAAGIATPDYDPERLAAGLRLVKQTAVKADARPANAVVAETGKVAWIDWDRAKCGSPLDDAISLLCDEYTTLSASSELSIMEDQWRSCPEDDFAVGARDYACIECVLKCCRRLDLIIDKLSRNGTWWDPQICLKEDRSGVSQIYVERLCARGSRWSSRHQETAGLAGFFEKLPDFLSKKWPL